MNAAAASPKLTRALVARLPQNGPTDPITFYRRPLVGWLFRQRINLGLHLLGGRRFDRALEVGYGSGAVLLALANTTRELCGIDLDADPVEAQTVLARQGIAPQLRQGSVLDLPYPDGHFELVVSFSVFEHLRQYRQALTEVRRVLAPHGWFLLGMPAVNRTMQLGFAAIGFHGIAAHHVTTPGEVAAGFAASAWRVRATRHFDFPAPPPAGLRLYYNWLLERA
jgi:SAM-dependent methyltransferase